MSDSFVGRFDVIKRLKGPKSFIFKAYVSLFCLMVLGFSSLASACAAQTCSKPEGLLDAAIAKTQNAIRSNDDAAFLSQIGSEGLMLGSEGAQLSRAELNKAFKAKTGVYCDLFVCKGKSGGLKALVLAPSPIKRMNTARNGSIFAVVTLNRGHATKETELHYAFVNCKWELMAIGTL
jgi:hypothetical protein